MFLDSLSQWRKEKYVFLLTCVYKRYLEILLNIAIYIYIKVNEFSLMFTVLIYDHMDHFYFLLLTICNFLFP